MRPRRCAGMSEILIADDDRLLRESLRRMLKGACCDVRIARDGIECLEQIRARRPDLVLLDIMMPRLDGFGVLAEIRREDTLLPVLLLTGKDIEANEVCGMGLGADDFISKDASAATLLARVRRALDRAGEMRRAQSNTSLPVLRLARATVDFGARLVRRDTGEEERLTGAELDILRTLASDRSRYFSHAELVAGMHGEGHVTEPTTIRSQISRLKRKLGPSGELIHNERDAGYRLLP